MSIIKLKWVILGIMGFISLNIFSTAFTVWYRHHSFEKNGIHVLGTVVDMRKSVSYTGRRIGRRGDGKPNFVYFPIVEFTTLDGQKYQFESSSGSNPSIYTLGNTVKVTYTKENPRNAQLTDGIEKSKLPLALVFFGLLLTFIGVLIFLYLKSEEKKRSQNEELFRKLTEEENLFQR